MNEPIQGKPKIVLSFAAQQYGLTAEDLCERIGCSIEDIEIEPPPTITEEKGTA